MLHLTLRAAGTATSILLVWLFLASYSATQPRVMEFNTAPPEVTPVTRMATAKAYAAHNGLTSCTTPDQAELDDVFLAEPVDAPGTIVEVGLDAALESAGKRHVILACQE